MFPKEVYQKVEAELERRRTEAKEESDRRHAEIRARSPRVAEIEKELSSTGMKIFRAACRGEDLTPLRNRNLELQKERTDIITSFGFPSNYTDVHPTCPRCNDSGYVDIKMCDCMRKLLVREAIAESGMGRLIGKQTFENFDLTALEGEEREKAERNLAEAKEFAKDFRPDSGRTLLMIGNTGTGKTHLSSAIAGAVIEKGYHVRYDSMQNVVSAFEQDKFHSGYGESESRGEAFLSCDLLILDDLGSEFVTAFSTACFYNLLATRQNRGLPTVLSTNLSPKELSEIYTDRVVSRLFGSDSTVLAFYGKDRRLG